MNISRVRQIRTETLLSIIIIFILVLIAVGVFIKQFYYDMEEFGIISDFGKELKSSEINIENLDTGSFAPVGYKKYLTQELYDSESLFEKINGKAPLYIDAGFSKLLSQRFAKTDDEKQWLELFIYEMNNQLSAFSAYSTQKRQDALLFPSIGEFAYRSSNSLFFILGKYYFEIIASSDSGVLFEAASSVAKKIKSDIFTNTKTDIPELSLMAHENIVPGSIKLNMKNAFGFSELADTFSAEYKVNGKSATGFISIQDNPEKAEDVAMSYYRFLLEYDGKEIKSNLDHAIKVIDLLDLIEIIFIRGRYAAGVHEAEDLETAEETAGILLRNIDEQLKQDKK